MTVDSAVAIAKIIAAFVAVIGIIPLILNLNTASRNLRAKIIL